MSRIMHNFIASIIAILITYLSVSFIFMDIYWILKVAEITAFERSLALPSYVAISCLIFIPMWRIK